MDALDYNRRLHFVSPSDEVPRGGLFRPTSQNLLPSREGATTKSALAGGARRVMVDSSKKRGVSEKPTPSKNLERGNYMKPTEAFKHALDDVSVTPVRTIKRTTSGNNLVNHRNLSPSRSNTRPSARIVSPDMVAITPSQCSSDFHRRIERSPIRPQRVAVAVTPATPATPTRVHEVRHNSTPPSRRRVGEEAVEDKDIVVQSRRNTTTTGIPRRSTSAGHMRPTASSATAARIASEEKRANVTTPVRQNQVATNTILFSPASAGRVPRSNNSDKDVAEKEITDSASAVPSTRSNSRPKPRALTFALSEPTVETEQPPSSRIASPKPTASTPNATNTRFAADSGPVRSVQFESAQKVATAVTYESVSPSTAVTHRVTATKASKIPVSNPQLAHKKREKDAVPLASKLSANKAAKKLAMAQVKNPHSNVTPRYLSQTHATNSRKKEATVQAPSSALKPTLAPRTLSPTRLARAAVGGHPQPSRGVRANAQHVAASSHQKSSQLVDISDAPNGTDIDNSLIISGGVSLHNDSHYADDVWRAVEACEQLANEEIMRASSPWKAPSVASTVAEPPTTTTQSQLNLDIAILNESDSSAYQAPRTISPVLGTVEEMDNVSFQESIDLSTQQDILRMSLDRSAAVRTSHQQSNGNYVLPNESASNNSSQLLNTATLSVSVSMQSTRSNSVQQQHMPPSLLTPLSTTGDAFDLLDLSEIAPNTASSAHNLMSMSSSFVLGVDSAPNSTTNATRRPYSPFSITPVQRTLNTNTSTALSTLTMRRSLSNSSAPNNNNTSFLSEIGSAPSVSEASPRVVAGQKFVNLSTVNIGGNSSVNSSLRTVNRPFIASSAIHRRSDSHTWVKELVDMISPVVDGTPAVQAGAEDKEDSASFSLSQNNSWDMQQQQPLQIVTQSFQELPRQPLTQSQSQSFTQLNTAMMVGSPSELNLTRASSATFSVTNTPRGLPINTNHFQSIAPTSRASMDSVIQGAEADWDNTSISYMQASTQSFRPSASVTNLRASVGSSVLPSPNVVLAQSAPALAPPALTRAMSETLEFEEHDKENYSPLKHVVNSNMGRSPFMVPGTPRTPLMMIPTPVVERFADDFDERQEEEIGEEEGPSTAVEEVVIALPVDTSSQHFVQSTADIVVANEYDALFADQSSSVSASHGLHEESAVSDVNNRVLMGHSSLMAAAEFDDAVLQSGVFDHHDVISDQQQVSGDSQIEDNTSSSLLLQNDTPSSDHLTNYSRSPSRQAHQIHDMVDDTFEATIAVAEEHNLSLPALQPHQLTESIELVPSLTGSHHTLFGTHSNRASGPSVITVITPLRGGTPHGGGRTPATNFREFEKDHVSARTSNDEDITSRRMLEVKPLPPPLPLMTMAGSSSFPAMSVVKEGAVFDNEEASKMLLLPPSVPEAAEVTDSRRVDSRWLSSPQASSLLSPSQYDREPHRPASPIAHPTLTAAHSGSKNRLLKALHASQQQQYPEMRVSSHDIVLPSSEVGVSVAGNSSSFSSSYEELHLAAERHHQLFAATELLSSHERGAVVTTLGSAFTSSAIAAASSSSANQRRNIKSQGIAATTQPPSLTPPKATVYADEDLINASREHSSGNWDPVAWQLFITEPHHMLASENNTVDIVTSFLSDDHQHEHQMGEDAEIRDIMYDTQLGEVSEVVRRFSSSADSTSSQQHPSSYVSPRKRSSSTSHGPPQSLSAQMLMGSPDGNNRLGRDNTFLPLPASAEMSHALSGSRR